METRYREYETVYLLRPDLNDEQVNNAREQLVDAIEDADGDVLNEEDWGLRDLAYEVRDDASGQQYERARYQRLHYIVEPEDATVVEDQLKFIEEMLKSLTVKLDDDLIREDRLDQPAEHQEGEVLPYEE